MTTGHRLYSPTEAAALSGIGLKAVNNAIAKHVVTLSRVTANRGSKAPRALKYDDLIRLKLWCMELALSCHRNGGCGCSRKSRRVHRRKPSAPAIW